MQENDLKQNHWSYESNNLLRLKIPSLSRWQNMLKESNVFWAIPNPKHIQENTVVAAAAKSLQSCPALCDPRDSSQAPLSLGFSRQEHCCYCCCVASVMFDSVRPHRRQPTRLPIPGILQARTLEWVAISFSNAWKWKVKVKSLSRVRL